MLHFDYYYFYSDEPIHNLSLNGGKFLGGNVDFNETKLRQAIRSVQNKIAKTKELLRNEEMTRDENANACLKLTTNVDEQRRIQIQTVFEKKSQKSAQNILLLQKRLDCYVERLKQYETQAYDLERSCEITRDISILDVKDPTMADETQQGSIAFDCGLTHNYEVMKTLERVAVARYHLDEGSVNSSLRSEDESDNRGQGRMQQFGATVEELQQQTNYFSNALREERSRCQRLEKQINDLTELHQIQLTNLKQTISEMEKKLQCQSERRSLNYKNNNSNNSKVRGLVVELSNIMFTVLQVILLFVTTIVGIVMPFFRTSCTKSNCLMCKLRIIAMGFVILATVLATRQWLEMRDIGTHLVYLLKQTLAVK